MTSSVPDSQRRRVLTRGLALAAPTLLAAALSACSTFSPTRHLVPGPAGPIGIATLSQSRVAILAGSAQSKGVFIIDLNAGKVSKSFGVTKQATGIAAERPDGPLLITVGGEPKRGHHIGAVERWSLSGQKMRVIPMPAEARGITRPFGGVAYVLVGNGDARAAIPLQLPALSRARPMPLEKHVRTMQQCIIGASPYLVYSAGNEGSVVIREIGTGVVVRSNVVADSPICIQGRLQVFAISHSFAAASIVMLSLPTLLQQGFIPTANDAITLFETEDHHLAELNGSPLLSNVEIFSDNALTPKPAST